MADLMAIVSKAVFEKAAGKAPVAGTKLAMDRYVSANKALEPLAANGRLFLVTVRPPNEALWLVAVLEKPKFDGEQWLARPCDKPIVDITHLRARLTFESGKGITAAAGALGMSLQTPRALTSEDTALLDAVFTGAPIAAAAPIAEAVAPETDRRALLLRAVLADPDHLAPRQVLADELTSHNDPRGEFILLEIALEGGLAIRKRDQLKQRRDELKAAHAAEWWPYKVKYRTRSGFVEFVAGSYQQLVSLAPKLFAAEPIVEVEINGVDAEENAEKITKLEWLAKLHALVLRGTIGDEAFATLCANKATAKLTSLNVTANELSAEAFADLGDNLPACRSLVLTANPFGDEGISALRTWQHLDKIETLYLSKCELTGDGLDELVSQPLPALRKLCLAGNELGGAMTALAKRAGNLPRLRHLELVGSGLGQSDIKALAKAELPDIYRIDVRRNDIDRRATRELGDRFRI